MEALLPALIAFGVLGLLFAAAFWWWFGRAVTRDRRRRPR